jgi:hypothetical protein
VSVNGFEAQFVRAAYEPVVRSMAESAARWNALYPRTPEDDRRRREREDAEDQRIITLMKSHGNEPGTTSMCLCGFVGYSTPGYLLHLYAVAVNDYVGRSGE